MKAILHSQCASSFYVPCHFYIMHVQEQEERAIYKLQVYFLRIFYAVNLLTEERDDHNPE